MQEIVDTADLGPMMYRVNAKNYLVQASCPGWCTILPAIER